MKNIYLDNASTTPLDPRVLDAMKPYFTHNFGNPSSLHTFGTEARNIIEQCRKTLTAYINADADELIFTSGGTEANNTALKGIAFANRSKGNHIIVSSIEHDCILHTADWLNSQGFRITYLPVDNTGMISTDDIVQNICSETILVSVMHANNEIGTVQPVEEIGSICRNHNIYFHTDACQTFGQIPVNVKKQNIDLLTLNSHKIYGPKGVGALYIRKNVRIEPLLHGGGQEASLRSSTENVPGIVGFAKAAELCFKEFSSEVKRISALRDKLIQLLSTECDGFYLNGHPVSRLPNNLNFSFHGLEGETIRLLLLLDEEGFAVSTGSACSSNDKTGNTSHVLQAIGLNPFEARGAIRVSLGRFTTEDHIVQFFNCLKLTINKLNPIFNN